MDQINKLLSDLTEDQNEQTLLKDIKNLQKGLLWYIDQVKTKGEDKIDAMQYLLYELMYVRDMLLVIYPSDVFVPNEDEGELDAFKD